MSHCCFILNCSKAGSRFPAIQFPLQMCQSNSSAFCSRNCWFSSSLWLTSSIAKLTNQHEDSGHLMDTCPTTNMNNQPDLLLSTAFLSETTELVFYQLSQGAASNTSLPECRGCSIPEEPHIHFPNLTIFHIQVFSSPRSRSLPDPLHFTGCFHHCKRLPTTPVPEMYLIGSGNQQELSRRMKSKRCNGIVAICEPALASTLERGVKNHKQFYHKVCYH